MFQESLAHLIILGFTGFVISFANPGSTLFSWHPSSMVLAWAFMTEGVLLFKKPTRNWRIALHWALQAGGLSLALFGFYAIYQNKEASGKAHFTTYHGLVGVFTVVLLIVQAVGGNLANYSVPLSNRIRFIKPKLVKWGHRSSGALSLSALSATVTLALFSFWFQSVTNAGLWWVSVALISYPLIYTLRIAYF